MDVTRFRSVTVTHPDTGEVFSFQRDRLTELWQHEGLNWSNEYLQEYIKYIEPCAVVKGYE